MTNDNNINNQTNIVEDYNNFNNYQQFNNQSNFKPNEQQQVLQNYTNNKINQSNNNYKSNKKIIVIVIIIIILLISIFIVYKLKANDSKKGKNNSISENIKMDGSIELLKVYEKKGYDIRLARGFEKAPYFKYINNDEKWVQIIDKNGNVLHTTSNIDHDIYYIGDGYFIDRRRGEEEFQIFNNGNTWSFKTHYNLNSYYSDNILYYSYQDEAYKTFTEAFNLKSGKVLWKIDGANPYVLENGKIFLQESLYNKKNKIIDDKTRQTVVKSNDENQNIYVTESCYYIEDNNKVDVYDYNNDKIFSYDLINNDEEYHKLAAVLSTGGFVIKVVDKNDNSDLKIYKVFNKYGKEIMSFEGDKVTSNSLYIGPYGGGNVEKNSSVKYSFIDDNQNKYVPLTYIIYQDDTVSKLYKISVNGDFAIGCVDDECKKIKIINLETKEEKILDERLKNEFDSPNSNNYFIINASVYDDENNYYVYNNKFKKIYESKNGLYVVNDEFFLEVEQNLGNSYIYLINSKDLNRKLLETNGNYDFHTANNIVTYDDGENKQWLYKFK